MLPLRTSSSKEEAGNAVVVYDSTKMRCDEKVVRREGASEWGKAVLTSPLTPAE